MILVLFSIILILCMVAERFKCKKYSKFYEKYKIDKIRIPLIGHAYYAVGKRAEDYMNVYKDFCQQSYQKGGLICGWLLQRFIIGVTCPIAAEVILKKCLEKDQLISVFRSHTGSGSIFAPVSIWRPRRKLLAPTFNMKNLEAFVAIFDEQSKVMVNCLKGLKDTVHISEYFTRYSMDAVCETSLGVKINVQQYPQDIFVCSLLNVLELVFERVLRPWLQSDFLYSFSRSSKISKQFHDNVYGFISKIVKAKRQSVGEAEKCNGRPKPFLAHLMDAIPPGMGGMGDKIIEEETLVILVAATDTSAMGSSFTALMLSQHPDVQDKCYQELQRVFGESDVAVTMKDLFRLKYLEAVIKETMRLYPPVPMLIRNVDYDLELPNGDTIPKGCGVVICTYGIHRNPLYWGADADEFRPERFLDEIKHPAAFIPFSSGPRNCLGYQYAMMSMKTVLVHLLRHYRLLPVLPGGKPEPIRFKIDLMLRDIDKFPLRIEPRI